MTFLRIDSCYSFFAKAEEYTKTAIGFGGGGYSSQPMAVINLLNGSVVSKQGFTSISVKNFSNGWYKISAVFTATSSVAPNIQPIADGFITTSDNYTYIGDGTSGINVWGAQFEEGSYPTSYIKSNSGTATTRSAETASGAGNSTTFDDSEGVLMAEISALANDGTERNLSLSNGTNANRVSWWFTATNSLAVAVYSGGSLQYFTNLSIGIATNSNKISFKYKQNNFSLWVNGFEIATDTSGITPVGLSELAFDRADSALTSYGKTKQLQYFDSALADTQLEQLTSWQSFRDMADGQLYTIE